MWFFNQIIRFRYLSVLLVLLITIFLGSQMGSLKVDNSNESFFAKNDPSLLALHDFYNTFGNDDFIYLLVDCHGKVNVDILSSINELVLRLQKEVSFVKKVRWLGNAETITADTENDTISISPLISSFDLSSEQVLNIINKATNDPLLRDKLVSADGEVLGIVIEFEDYPNDLADARALTPPSVFKILDDFKNLDIRASGVPIMSYFNNKDTASEGQVWIITGFALIILMLIIITRSILGTILPLLTVLLAIIMTMGLFAIFGFTLNMLIMMIPVLLLCVGIGDSLHLIAEFRQECLKGLSKTEALQKTLKLVSWPLFLTTVTTALGFVSFIFTDLVPLRQLGMQAAIGTFIAFVLTFLFVLPLLTFSRMKPNKDEDQKVEHRQIGPTKTVPQEIYVEKSNPKSISFISKLVLGAPWIVILVFSIIFVVSLWGMTEIKLETAFIQDLPKNDPLRHDFEFADERMGGSMSAELVVDAGVEDGVRDIKLIDELASIQDFLNNHPLVRETFSFLDLLKQMNMAIHHNDKSYYTIPKTRELVSELLFLYESGGGEQLDKTVSFAYDAAHIQIRTKSLCTSDIKQLQDDLYTFTSVHTPDLQSKLHLTGGLALVASVADYLSSGQKTSFLCAFITILIVMSLVFRSVKIGLLSMIPNVVPVIITLGVIGLSGIRMNMVLVILAPIVLGVCIDDTIHFISRFKQNFAESGNYRTAYLMTISSVGRVLIYTTLVTSSGLLGFMCTKFAGPFAFAWSSVLAFVSALLCDLLLTPAVIIIFKPFGPEKVDYDRTDSYVTNRT